MSRKPTWLVGVIVLITAMAGTGLAQTTGKIRGRVVDLETREVLVGANVILENTTLGAVAGVDGEYIILNVPPGLYSVRAAYVGYRTTTIRDVRVTVGLTTEAQFELKSEAVEVAGIEIIAQAPLINKNATNTVNIARAENIERLPVRTVAEIFSLAPGVVQQGGSFYVRGGRSEETAYYIDGVLVNNPMNGALNINIINNAVEEVQTQIGGMTAQYGNAMSGIVSTTTKTGGVKYTGMLELITDNLGNDEEKFLDTYSYGQSEYVLTLGGPVVPSSDQFRFFLAGQRRFNRSDPSFLDGISFPYIDSTQISGADFTVVDENDVDGVNTAPTGSTGNRAYLANLLNSSSYNGGRALGGVSLDSWGFQGNVYGDFGAMNVKVGGSYSQTKSIGNYGRGLDIISVTAGNPRGTLTDTWDASVYLKFTHILDPATFYSVQLNYYAFQQENGDQIWMDNIESYGDPNLPENAILVGPSRNPAQYSVWSFTGNWPGIVPQQYTKIYRGNFGGRLDVTHQFGRSWEFIAGGDLTYYTIRQYAVNARNLYSNRLQNPGASDWTVYNLSNVAFYGYDIYGEEFDGGTFTDKTGRTVDLSKEGP
ncbi:MAG: TonB-dependent receptor, partial [Bacteroidetes bacterium]|nr:TonB-dependent receptor [Bacteroidota bacterium]